MKRRRYTLLRSNASGLALGVGLGGVLLVAVLAWPYTVDDAFITARYACNIAAGRGYAMNAHDPSDGVTGPLWLVPGTIACAARIDPVLAAKAIGLLCALVAIALLLRALRRRAGGRAAACVAALVLALSPSIATWAVAGLETGAATLGVTLAALAAIRRPRPAAWSLGAAGALLAWLRPELALSYGVLLAYVALRDRRAAARALAAASLGAGALIAFRLALFGDVVPLAYRAKSGTLAYGLSYTTSSVVLATTLAGVVLAVRAVQRGGAAERALAAALIAHLAALVLAGGDWMPGYRLLVPVLPLYAWLAGVGAVRGFRAHRWLGVALVALACALPALDLVTRIGDMRASTAERARAVELAGWLRAHARSVALVDVGVIGYASGLPVVDLGGLTDPRIARAPGGHLDKRIAPAYLRERDPDAIVLHTSNTPQVGPDRRLLPGNEFFAVERRVAEMRFVRERYRVARAVHYARDYEYIVLVRDRNQDAAR
jgi:hypothetical protein